MIIVLAVLFWPVIFVGPEGELMSRDTQVPSIPSLRKMQLDAPEPLQGVAPARMSAPEADAEEAQAAERAMELVAVSAAEQAETSSEESRAVAGEEEPGDAEAPRLDEEGIPVAWTLQVISVSKQEKAEALMQELIAMDYEAYFKAVKHGNGTLYRVYVGPKFDRARMLEAKREIDRKFRVKSILARYLP